MKPRSDPDPGAPGEPPLCVDLDGTLLPVDTLQERVLEFLRRRWWQAWRLPLWLLHGKAHFKQHVAAHTTLDVTGLPATPELVELLQQEKSRGRRILLVTGADAITARQVAARFPFFDEVLSTTGATNLTGDDKLALLVERFGERGFDYAGNSAVDRSIWRAARECILVNASASLQRVVKAESNVVSVLGQHPGGLNALRRVLRIQQWPKNILLVVPAITGHKIGDPDILGRVALGMGAFCLCASSVYVVNDLHDLAADRAHRTKRTRPFAAGQFPLGTGLALAPVLLALAFFCAAWLPPMFAVYLGIYYFASTIYSWALKKIVLLDVFVLAGLYTLRILAGHGATGIGYSNWLLGFSLFTFLSLALLKRYIELHRANATENEGLVGRGYVAGDLQVVLTMGMASGYLAALVLALYINSKEVLELYRQPLLLLFICPLILYWMSRVWLLATRDRIDDDPVVFALKDRTSYAVGLLVALFIWLASVL